MKIKPGKKLFYAKPYIKKISWSCGIIAIRQHVGKEAKEQRNFNRQVIIVINLQVKPPIEHIHCILEDQFHNAPFQSRNYQNDLDDISQAWDFFSFSGKAINLSLHTISVSFGHGHDFQPVYNHSLWASQATTTYTCYTKKKRINVRQKTTTTSVTSFYHCSHW